MVVIWRGYGWLVPVLVFGAFLVSQVVVDTIYGDGFYKANDWPKYTATVTGALIVAALGYLLNYKWRRELVDEETGQPAGKAPSHTLFFIPVEYWSVIVLALFFWVTA